MSQPMISKPSLKRSAAYALLKSHEPIAPYELDPAFENPAVGKRIGEVIAKAMGRRLSKRMARGNRAGRNNRQSLG
jgi:hypothetical protein